MGHYGNAHNSLSTNYGRQASGGIREAARHVGRQSWICGRGYLIAVFPIRTPDHEPAALVATTRTGQHGLDDSAPASLQGGQAEQADQSGGTPDAEADIPAEIPSEIPAEVLGSNWQQKSSFLEELVRILSDQLHMHSQMSSLSGELSSYHQELCMLRLRSARRHRSRSPETRPAGPPRCAPSCYRS